MKFITHRAYGVNVALALALAACGEPGGRSEVCGDLVCSSSESAGSCAEDCGCGNGMVNAGEDCDGADLGGASCASVGQGSGMLGCNVGCTFDFDRCDASSCGNGIAEPGEECDGSDLGATTCASAGFAAGQIACTTSCTLDVAACCNNFCDAADTSVCAGDAVETCTLTPQGCLALEVTNCAVGGLTCDDSSGTATCGCVDGCPSAGAGRCLAAVAQSCTEQTNGCLAWTSTIDCAATGRTCAIGPSGATCASSASAEDCFDRYTLSPGQNLVAWTATNEDYFTEQPSCGAGTLTGPDLVLSYTATVDGLVAYSIAKQADMRHVVAVTQAACGTVTEQAEVSCALDTDTTSVGNTFAVTTGTTYYFYVRDTTTGSAPLPNPLLFDLEEASCAGLANGASDLSPANGSTVSSSSPNISLQLAYPVIQNAGVITLTGDRGTVFSYDLATSPPEVAFSDNGRRISIDPGAFLPGETVAVSWSGLTDQICGVPVAPPTWTFALGTASCSPGVGGMVGTTVTTRSTGLSSLTELYVTVDQDPNGFVYFGGQTELFRMPKAGGEVESVVTAAVLGSSQLGYALVAVGAKVFSLDTLASTTSPFLWRLTTSSGVSWNPLGYAKYTITPGGGAKSMFHHGGRLYWVTDETTATVATEIWSVSASATQLPAPPVLEASLDGVNDCDSITGDANYFYLGCDDDNDHIVRVDRTTDQVELITDAIPLSLTKNELHVDDLDGDGVADVMYVKSDDQSVRYVCNPGGAAPFWHDVLVEFGPTTTGNYGLGFDPAAKTLWAFDDDTRELVIIR